MKVDFVSAAIDSPKRVGRERLTACLSQETRFTTSSYALHDVSTAIIQELLMYVLRITAGCGLAE